MLVFQTSPPTNGSTDVHTIKRFKLIKRGKKRQKSPWIFHISPFAQTNLPEQSFQIFRQLRPAGISWIHGYKKPNCRHQRNFLSLEDEALFLVFDSVLNRFDLHCDHRQHFNWDPVELIETAPGSCLRQAFVNVTNWLKKEKKLNET